MNGLEPRAGEVMPAMTGSIKYGPNLDSRRILMLEMRMSQRRDRPFLIECARDEMSKGFWLDLALFLDRVHVDAIPEPFAPANV